MIKRAAIVFIVLGMVLLTAGFSRQETTPATPEANNPSYWGANCFKIDDTGGIGATLTVGDVYDVLVLKSANTNYAFYDAVPGDVVATNGQDISHIIKCPPTSETPSPTPTATATPTESLTPTPSTTPTTGTPPPTPTPVITPSVTPSVTPTPSTPTPTAMPTVTPTASPTPKIPPPPPDNPCKKGELACTDSDATRWLTWSGLLLTFSGFGILGLRKIV